MINAILITPESYSLYSEIVEDEKRTPLELHEVNNFYMLMDRSHPSPKIWFMSPSRFESQWTIVEPETKTKYAIVIPK